ncbi:MAG: alpha/beta hydrolase [Pseudomonadota bacterium]
MPGGAAAGSVATAPPATDPATGSATNDAGHRPIVPLPPGARAWDLGLDLLAEDGVALRAALWNPGGPRGLALLLSGRVEFLEKLALAATALADRGYAVAVLDWRGQGLSERLTDDPRRAHVGDFAEYHRDLAALVAHPAVAAEGSVRIIVSHSMGACILRGALAKGVVTAEKLVFSAPLAAIRMHPVAAAVAPLLIYAARWLGFSRLWPPVYNPGRPYVLKGFAGNCLSRDPVLYGWYENTTRTEPRLALGLPTLGWLAAATDAMAANRAMGGTGIPSLVLLGSREGVVDPKASKAMARRIEARLSVIEGGMHDLFIDAAPIRAAVWDEIDAFLGPSA